MHRLPIVFSMLSAALLSGCDDVAIAQDATAESCRMCHRGPLRLQSDSADALIERIRAAAAGELPHPSALPALSEEEIAALADELMGD